MATLEDLFGEDAASAAVQVGSAGGEVSSSAELDAGADGNNAVTMDDLFGDDLEDEGDDANVIAADGGAGAGAIEPGQGTTLQDIFGSDDLDVDAAVEEPQQQSTATSKRAVDAHGKANLHLPAIPRLSSGHSKVALVRLPRVVAVAPQTYDASTYSESDETAWLKGIDKTAARESVIRYRLKRDAIGVTVVDSDGHPVRESNTRVVEWADGSLTLHVGKEAFSLRRATRQPTPAQAGQQEASGAPSAAAEDGFVFARVTSAPPHEGGRKETVLEAHAAVSQRLVAGALAGTSIISSSVLETRAARSRAIKRARVQQIALSLDPEIEKQKRIKQEEEAGRIAAMQRRKADEARRKAQERGSLYGSAYGGAAGASYGVDDDEVGAGGDDDGTFNLGAMKKSSKNSTNKRKNDSYDEDDEDDEE